MILAFEKNSTHFLTHLIVFHDVKLGKEHINAFITRRVEVPHRKNLDLKYDVQCIY